MLYWLNYSTVPTGLTFLTEKPQKFKTDKTPFLSLVFHNDWVQNHCWLSVKSMTPNFVVVFKDLMPIFCHIGSGVPYLHIFVEEIVAFLGAMD